MDDLAKTVLRHAADPELERVVVDLRHNPGGGNTTYAPLLRALAHPSVDRADRVVALLGRTTFSAAVDFATELAGTTNVVFVGERAGGSPGGYTDPEPITLPATGWSANVATARWSPGGASRADNGRPSIVPDLPVTLSSHQFFSGRDPVLAAALALPRR